MRYVSIICLLLILLATTAFSQLPTVSLSVNNSSISEVNGTATVTATLSAPATKNIIIDLVPSGTATYNKDYSIASATGVITVAGGNSSGSGTNQLSNPHGIFIDANENIYIADLANHRIQKWVLGASE